MKTNRRGFLHSAAGVLAGGALLVEAASSVHGQPISADSRGNVGDHLGLELGGAFAGWVQSVAGGYATADVVSERIGPDHVIRKHLAGLRYEPLAITCGTGMSKQFYAWISNSLNYQYERKDGAVVTASSEQTEQSRLAFTGALLAGVEYPAVDVESKDAAKMTVTIDPEVTRFQRLSGNARIGTNAGPGTQKTWLAANFRLQIPGLEQACSRVNKIDPVTVRQKNPPHTAGEQRDVQREPSNLEYSNLVFSVPESHADDLYRWHEDFVIRGNNGAQQEKSGTLEYLAPDRATVLFRLNFHGLGIFKLVPEKIESRSEGVQRVTAHLYITEVKFDAAGAAM